MKTLYLAIYTLHCSPYMEESYEEDGMRLVWARNAEDAEHVLRQAVEVSYSYSLNKYVEGLVLTEALGDQIDV